jgi:Ser-tRNA(Ala) deacylase AlaX
MDMKRKTILILGIIIAIIASVNNFSYADISLGTDENDIEFNSEQLAEEILKANLIEKKETSVYKVYNSSDQLVYQTRNKNDEKFTQLIRQSDFITEVNKISYYKLSR